MDATQRRTEESQTEARTVESRLAVGAGVKTATKYSPRRKTVLMMSALVAWALWAAGQPDDKRIEDTLRKIDEVVAQGPFRVSWESLETYRVPEWYLGG